MKKQFEFILASFCLAMVLTLGCGGLLPSINVTFTSPSATTDVALDTSISAQFSGVITVPADWSTVLSVTKSGGANVCTSDVITYNSTTKTVTCQPATELDAATEYTATMTGIVRVNDNTLTFTTEAAVIDDITDEEGAVNKDEGSEISDD